MCSNVSQCPILAAVPLIDRSVRSGLPGSAAPSLYRKGRDPRPRRGVDMLVYAAPNYAHPLRLQNTIAGGTSSIVIAVAQQPEAGTAQPTIWRPEGEFLDLVRRATLNLLAGLITVAISGCVGPPVLERQVLGYDEVTKTLDEKLLLLNIARVSNQEPVHFTSTSSIAATFNWTATLGTSGQ